MQPMLRQPLWHRVLRELLAERAMLRLGQQQRAWRTRSITPTGKPLFRVALAGCGRVARRNAHGYLQSGRALLVAAADPVRKQRWKARIRFAVERLYTDYNEMLAKEQIDILSVCAPPRFHSPMVMAAARSGVKAILCEKPLGLDLREADDMIRICQDHHVVLATNHQRRFAAQHILVKQLLAEGTIGCLRLVYAACPRDTLRAGIHVADMLNDYIGPAQSVVACLNDGRGGAIKAPREASLSGASGDKQGRIVVTYANGVHAVLRIKDRGGQDAKLVFLGDKGEIELWWDGGIRYRLHADARWCVPSVPINPYILEFQRAIEALMDAVETQTEPPISGRDGRNSLELILAILTANAEGVKVTLPLPTDAQNVADRFSAHQPHVS